MLFFFTRVLLFQSKVTVKDIKSQPLLTSSEVEKYPMRNPPTLQEGEIRLYYPGFGPMW
jgi:hypothetical protein